jgi:hypothetical protein
MIKNKVKKDQLFQNKPVNIIMTKTIAERVLCFKTDALEAIKNIN